jgi:hypothetical protein
MRNLMRLSEGTAVMRDNRILRDSHRQGDQNGSIFYYWWIVFFGLFFLKITDVALLPKWTTFFHGKGCVGNRFDTKMVLATFWAIFSQTHLVALPTDTGVRG